MNEQQPFASVCQQLADAMVAMICHENCPQPIEERLSELHSFVMSEYGSDLAADIKRRFAEVLASAPVV